MLTSQLHVEVGDDVEAVHAAAHTATLVHKSEYPSLCDGRTQCIRRPLDLLATVWAIGAITHSPTRGELPASGRISCAKNRAQDLVRICLLPRRQSQTEMAC